MKRIQTFDGFVNEAASLTVVPVGLKGEQFFVKVNGNEYGYAEKEGDLDIKQIAEKFKKLLKYSSGRALAWLKKHTELSSGSAKNESEDFDLVGFDSTLFEDDDFEVENIEEAKKDKEDKEEEKKEEKEEKKEEKEEKKEEEPDAFTPTSGLSYVKKYLESHKDKMDKGDIEKFEKLQKLLEDYIVERRKAGRHY